VKELLYEDSQSLQAQDVYPSYRRLAGVRHSAVFKPKTLRLPAFETTEVGFDLEQVARWENQLNGHLPCSLGHEAAMEDSEVKQPSFE